MEENNTTPHALKEWPGAFGLFKVSREGIRTNIGPLLTLIISIYVVTIALRLFLDVIFGKTAAYVMDQLFSLVIGVWFAIAFARITLASARHQRLEVDKSLPITWELFRHMFILELLLFVSIVGGLILLIVPGVIIGCRLSLAQYYLVDLGYGPLEAYKASWRATKGHLGIPLGVAGVTLLIILPVVTIIGAIATAYLAFMYSAAGALVYLFLSKQSHAKKASEQ